MHGYKRDVQLEKSQAWQCQEKLLARPMQHWYRIWYRGKDRLRDKMLLDATFAKLKVVQNYICTAYLRFQDFNDQSSKPSGAFVVLNL